MAELASWILCASASYLFGA